MKLDLNSLESFDFSTKVLFKPSPCPFTFRSISTNKKSTLFGYTSRTPPHPRMSPIAPVCKAKRELI